VIPPRILQTGPPNLPLLLKAAMTNVALLHPGFEIKFFDDAMIEAFLEENFPQYRGDYHSFRYRIQKYDFFRYLAVYRFGGFYLDLDIFLAQPLTPLLESACVFPFEELAESEYFPDTWGMDWQIGQYAFGSEAGHPFLAAIIENCLRAKKDAGFSKPMMRGIPSSMEQDYYILNTTGPGLVSRTFAENQELVKDVRVLFPEDVCDQTTWHQFGEFGVHQMVGSWRPSRSLWSRYRTRLWERSTLKRMLTQGRARGKTRSTSVSLSPR
jgi:inositol phosphorylceramide mannosyltransferase catalytic subunit